MKNDLPYFSHDNDARNHPKMKALRAQYGIAGYGLFWMLNEMISQAEHARLDLSKKINRTAVAGELGMSLEQFESFLAFLSDPEYDLVNYKDGILTTDRTQDDYAGVKAERDRKKGKYHSSTEAPRKNDNSPGRNQESPGRNDTEQSRAEERREEQQHARARLLVDNLAEELKRVGLVLPAPDLEALALRMTAKNLDLPFVAFCVDRIARQRGVKNVRGLLKKTLLEYDDAAQEYSTGQQAKEDTRIAPAPKGPCACGGKIRTNTHLGEGICTECGTGYVYDWDSHAWIEEKVPANTS